jgi:hypothetical protein
MVARNNHRRPCNNHKQAILKQQKHEKRAMTRLEDGGSELLEGGVIDLELGLGDLDEHFIVLATGELTLVLAALARAATVVENGDLRAHKTHRGEMRAKISWHRRGGAGGIGRRRSGHAWCCPCGVPHATRILQHMHAGFCTKLITAQALLLTAQLGAERTHDGREVLGGHAVRAKLLRGGPLGARADLRVGRGNRTEDGSASACIVHARPAGRRQARPSQLSACSILRASFCPRWRRERTAGTLIGTHRRPARLVFERGTHQRRTPACGLHQPTCGGPSVKRTSAFSYMHWSQPPPLFIAERFLLVDVSLDASA